MNTEPKDGGPAYIFKCRDMKVYYGMSLRDYFAGQALQGMMTEGFMPNMAYQAGNTRDFNYAVAAYSIANAMLKAREQKE